MTRLAQAAAAKRQGDAERGAAERPGARPPQRGDGATTTRLAQAALAAFILAACAAPARESARGGDRVERPTRARVEKGKASYYAKRFHGRKTANGERFDVNGMTAAHRKLPFGTRVRVTNLKNGRSVVVRINDRGPFSRGRVIDLSPAAAREIGMIKAGIVPVEVEVLSLPPRCAKTPSC